MIRVPRPATILGPPVVELFTAEGAELAPALAAGASDFLAGQVIPVSGGWAT